MSGGNNVIPGRIVPPETKAEFDSLLAVFDTKSAMDRLDAYGKWLFGSSAIVGSLGAGLSSSAFSKLRSPGTYCFAVAILMFGACLVLASLSIAPKWVKVKLEDLQSLREAVNTQFEKRQLLLTVASVLFAIALALAALSPFLSLIGAKTVALVRFSVDQKGVLEASLEASDLRPGTLAELRLEGMAAGGAKLPSTVATVDESGQIKLTLQLSDVTSSLGALEVVSCLKKPGGTECFDSRRLAVR